MENIQPNHVLQDNSEVIPGTLILFNTFPSVFTNKVYWGTYEINYAPLKPLSDATVCWNSCTWN